MPTPTHTLPETYRETRYLDVTDPSTLVHLNLLSLVGLVASIIGFVGWYLIVQIMRGPVPGGIGLPSLVLWLAVIAVFGLHEWIHGLAIRWAGHRPRYGAVTARLTKYIAIPYALYATADNAYFPRNVFIVIALAPLIVISILCMVLLVLLPNSLAFYVIAAAVLNGSGAIGDVWMTWIALKYPPDVLIQDEAVAIRIFAPEQDDHL